VIVRRPSRVSNVRVFCGVSIRAHTRVMIVADWIAGQFTGSRRSKRCLYKLALATINRIYVGRNENLWVQILTFMYNSLENRVLLGGCNNKIPCIKSSVWIINKSYSPSFALPNNLSKQFTSLIATFHSNPSCSLKNSRKAGSAPSSSSAFLGGGSRSGSRTLRRFSALVLGCDCEDCEERQICARRPST